MHKYFASMLCDNLNHDGLNESKPENFEDKDFSDVLMENSCQFGSNIPSEFLASVKIHDKTYKFEEQFRPIETDEGICWTFNMLNYSEIFTENNAG